MTVYSTVSARHARFRAIVAPSFAVGFSRPGVTVRAAAFRGEMPGFFALAAEAPTLRATCRHRGVTERSPAPCAHRLGERTERQCRGRALSPRDAARQSPSLPRLFAEPGPRFPASGFSAHRYRDPTRLPRIQSTVGDQPSRLDRGPTIRRHQDQGPLRSLDLRAPSHPFAKRMTGGPVRAFRLPVAWRSFLVGPRGLPWTHRRDASNPLLQPTFRVTSTRSENTLFGDCPPSAVGHPAGVRFEILRATGVATCRHLGSRKTPDHLAVIRPPTAACLTARCRLRVEGRPRGAFALHGESAAAFSAAFTLRRSNPLTPPGRSWRGRVSAASAFAELVSTSGTSMPPAFASSRRLPPEKSGAGALSDTCPGAPSPLAGGRRCCTCSSTIEDLD